MSTNDVQTALREAARQLAIASMMAQGAKLAEPELRDIEACILEAAPPATEQGLTVPALAARAGYSPNGRFRAIVRNLVKRGLLAFNYRFVRRA